MDIPDFSTPCYHTRAGPGMDTWDIDNINELELSSDYRCKKVALRNKGFIDS